MLGTRSAITVCAMATMAMNALEQRAHRRVLIGGVLRAVLTAVLLVTLYYVAPMNEPLGWSAGIRLVVCLFVLAGALTWQIRSILRSRYPAIRAGEVVAFSATLFLLVFASTYFLLSGRASGNFDQALTRTDALYFTISTFATVGFGDITATSEVARVIVMVQMVLDLLILGLGLRVVLGVVRIGRERLAAGTDAQVAGDQGDKRS
jgi:voltage-gated potassium channel